MDNDESDNTWKPFENLKNAPILVKRFEKNWRNTRQK